jgi:nucleotide-binding universal stress UspA family protein
VAYSVEHAKRYGASLIGIGVVDLPELVPPESVPLGAGPFKRERDEALLSSANEMFDQALNDFSRLCAVKAVASRTLKLEGDPAKLLAAESQRVELVIVGKKQFPEGEWETSSHTLRSILQNAPRPVLCVPESPVEGDKVLIAYDGSLQSAKTLQLFLASGLANERTLHLVTVADDGQILAERAIDFLRAHGRNVQTHIEEGNHAAERILQVAQALSAGIIVMGAYGKPRVREFLFGSVTQSILHHTKVPLFLYH